MASQDNGNDGPSPSPSPCLSAYSATSSSTTDSEFDELGSLCLDDWGFPTPGSSATPSGRGLQQRPSVQIDPNTPVSKTLSPVSGTSTPVPGSRMHSLGSLARQQQIDNDARGQVGADARSTELVLEEDEEENGASGFDVEDEDEEDMHANGVPAARGWRLDVR